MIYSNYDGDKLLRRHLAQKLMKHITRTKKEVSPYYELCVNELSKMKFDTLMMIIDVAMAEEILEEGMFEIK